MKFFLTQKLKSIGRHGKPSKQFVLTLEKKLIEKGASVTAVNVQDQSVQRDSFFFRATRYSAVALSLILCLSVGTSAYAYSSEDVLPDHPLYGLRQAVEVIEEQVAVTPTWKERVVKKHLERKQKEIQRLLERRPELKNLPEGPGFQSIEMILGEGVSGQKEPFEVRDQVLKEVRDMQQKDIRPAAKRQLRRIERRMGWMEGLHKR